MPKVSCRSVTIDPIRLEVVRNRLIAVTEEMAISLQRAAYSTNIKTRRDFSCAIFDRSGRLIAQSFSQAVHLGSLSHFVPKIIADYGAGNFRPGDAILCNDGYGGGVHLNDVCLVSPIFENGVLVAYVANIAHHLDVGGGTPGSMVGYSTEIIQEGLRIPPTLLVREGRIDKNIFNFLLKNVRAVRETAGDLRAQLAGVTVGQKRFMEAAEQFGMDFLLMAMSELLDYTERRTREELRSIPEGIYRAEDFMDGDGNDNTPVRVVVTVSISADSVVFDLTGSDSQRRGPINATYAMALSCCAYALRALLSRDLPVNDGFYRVIKLIAPEGTVVNAQFPAPIGGGWETGNRLTETALLAFSQGLPERVPAASKGCFCNVAFGGTVPDTSSYFMFYETVCGGYGARATKDGIDGIQAHGQNTENSPIEEMEANYPVDIVRYELIADSEGPGRFRGGLGVRRDYRFRQSVTFSVLSDRASFSPWGLQGGGEASRFDVILNPGTAPQSYGSKVSVKVEPTDIVRIQTGGGGGYGDPLQRDPQAVLGDVRARRISPARAMSAYGVVVGETLTLDVDATKEMRKRLFTQRFGQADSGEEATGGQAPA